MRWCSNEIDRGACPSNAMRWSLIGLLGIAGACACAQEVRQADRRAPSALAAQLPEDARPAEPSTAGIESFDGVLLMGTPFRAFSQRALSIAGAIGWTQLTPKPDDPLYGSHSIDVIVARDGAISRIDLEQFAVEMSGNLSKVCDAHSRELPMPVPLEGVASVVSCATSSFIGGDMATILLTFYGPRHVYSIQWKEWVRAPAQIDLNDKKWEQRMHQMLPLYFCAPVRNNPKISNCVSPKQMRRTLLGTDSSPAAQEN